MDTYALSIVVFVALLAVILYHKRKKLTVKYFVYYEYNTQRGKRFIERLVKGRERFWRVLGNIGIVLSTGAMLFGLYFIVSSLLASPGTQTLALILPTASQQASADGGFFFLPFWHFIIGIAVLMVVHEGFHGIMAREGGVRIKSLGWILLAILPGAFVKLDDKQLARKPLLTQLRVFAAGSFANLLTAGLFFILLIGLFEPAFTTGAVTFVGYVNATAFDREPFPAQAANMTGSILYIDGQRVEKVWQLMLALSYKKPGDAIEIQTTDGLYQLIMAENPERPGRGYLGITTSQDLSISERKVLSPVYKGTPWEGPLRFLRELMNVLVGLNLGVAIANMLPARPFDGGWMFKAITEKYVPSISKPLVNAAFLFVFGILLLSIFGRFIF